MHRPKGSGARTSPRWGSEVKAPRDFLPLGREAGSLAPSPLGAPFGLREVKRHVKRPLVMRENIRLVSSAGTGFTYYTTKNKRTQTAKLELKKYDPVARKHVPFKEAKMPPHSK